MSWLAQLDLSNNLIATRPAALANLPAATRVILTGNPLINTERKTAFIATGVWTDGVVLGFDSVTDLLNYGWVNSDPVYINFDGFGLRSLDGISTVPSIDQALILYAPSNNITSISSEITALTALEHLNLDYNAITTIPSAVALLSTLQNFSIRRNLVSAIDDSFWGLTNLTYADFSSNQLTSLSELISGLTSVATLIFDGNFFNTVPSSLATMTWLRRLDLRYTQLTEISETLTTLAAYATIDVFGCPIPGLLSPTTQAMTDADRQQFFLQNKYWKDGIIVGFDSVADMINRGWKRDQDNLWMIDLYNAGLRSLDGLSTVPYVDQVTTLYAHCNTLTVVPAEIASVSGVQTIHLEQNQIATVADEIAQLQNLQYLFMRENSLTTYSPGMCQIPNIEVLDTSYNQITTLPDTLATLTTLRILVLNGNSLTTLPDSIATMPMLTDLQICSNDMGDLVGCLGCCPNLKSLYAINNTFTYIPDEIAMSPSIIMLQIEQNPISAYPEQLFTNTTLQCLISDVGCTDTTTCALNHELNPNYRCTCGMS
jgi:internalin A